MTDSSFPTFASLVDQAVVVTGPTASGKSALAIELAERIDGEILSLDSIAVYRGMDIGTAKPTPEQRGRVPHHLLDLASPDQDFSVACYLQAAHRCVQEVLRRGRRPIFAGGTPMYLKAILRGFDPGPPPDWEFRKSVERDLEVHGVDALRERLSRVDPLSAHRIAPGDTRRMIRALEVAKHTGVPLSHRQIQFDQSRPADSCSVFALRWPRPTLHQRINQRVDHMFEAGLIDEVKGLLEDYGQLSRTACQAVGYREVLQWLSSESSDQDELKELVAAHTRQLARRQETWFRSFSEVTPIDMNSDNGVIGRPTLQSLVDRVIGHLQA
ncbi:tRNA (adenosine(37)-N6)-dimethylallyltransferase MiaA [Roseiconus nitratireducens]|uniref:tRNA dimethylallyltransferase n=1 Tax=Roseiconus nitratireducens TaxID=2605748 RepID=A0A5M6D167_9BACT|nr:tRNA (adenosine(37)-N6)-dimethylallyltransferase MiaA [Roseiconus nitratireducens]KAA5540032.1 tRNA (adenosine(37)-N6)-dimethylallyltransferase MiaA [Roseiconus nitratireducens]